MNPDIISELVSGIDPSGADPRVLVVGDSRGLPLNDVTAMSPERLLGDGDEPEGGIAGASYAIVVLCGGAAPTLLERAHEVATKAVIVCHDEPPSTGAGAPVSGSIDPTAELSAGNDADPSHQAVEFFEAKGDAAVALTPATLRPWLTALQMRTAAADLSPAERGVVESLAERYLDATVARSNGVAPVVTVGFAGGASSAISGGGAQSTEQEPSRPEWERGLAVAFLGSELRRLHQHADEQGRTIERLRAREDRHQAQIEDLAMRLGQSLVDLAELREQRNELQRRIDGHADSMAWRVVVRLWKARAFLRRRAAAVARIVRAPFRRLRRSGGSGGD